MPNFTLRWANRSHSTQDWMISNGDNFTLEPDYVRHVQIEITHDYTYHIAVTTNASAAATLTYTASTNEWRLASVTPNEWGFAQGNNIVTVRCKLADITEIIDPPVYLTEVPKWDPEISDGRNYPAYQLYKDNTGTTYCSRTKVKGHSVGKEWVRACLRAHWRTRCDGKPWLNQHQSGTLWP
jgi:hypothetical protein